jgi:hypothetical protein
MSLALPEEARLPHSGSGVDRSILRTMPLGRGKSPVPYRSPESIQSARKLGSTEQPGRVIFEERLRNGELSHRGFHARLRFFPLAFDLLRRTKFGAECVLRRCDVDPCL